MHGEHNYPAQKQRSSVDVGLPDGIGDAQYLEALDRHLPEVIAAARADIVFYLAGVDVVAGDRYGRFALSDAGLLARDQRVVAATRGAGLPLVITLAGGYAATAERTAELHLRVFEAAASACCDGGA
jgi:acetoin utilization deacetylase AcuC-like enzyme